MDRRYAIGNFIFELRKEKGLTQKELGELMGVTNKAVSKWETGAALPRMEYLRDLAEVLGCTQEELFLGHRIKKGENGEKSAAEESYISVVQRCDLCKHEARSDRKGLKCKKCGAGLEPKPAWIILALLIVGVSLTSAAVAALLLDSHLTICNFYAERFPSAEEASFYRELHEHFPHLEQIGWLARAALFITFFVIAAAVGFLVLFLLRKRVKYRIVRYPHSEDGKIVF